MTTSRPPRPLQARVVSHRNCRVIIPSSSTAPARSRCHSRRISLAPTYGPNRPPWEGPLTLPSGRSGLIREATPSQTLIHIAEVHKPLDEKDLASSPEGPVQFQDADGVKRSSNGRRVEHSFHRDTRQAVVSTNWLHRNHENAVVSWTVATPRAAFEYGDIFVGLTEADAFNHSGCSIAFDTHANYWIGYAPQNLTMSYRRKHLKDTTGATCTGNFTGGRDSVLRVTADFSGHVQMLRLELFPSIPASGTQADAMIEYPLHVEHRQGWRAARLLVSFRSQLDIVEILG